MATLIDEFGSFNKEGKFQYCDYHTKAEYGVYDSSEINLKEMYIWTDANSEFTPRERRILLQKIFVQVTTIF